MGEITNRPCMDMRKFKELYKTYCEKNGLDPDLNDAIDKCFIGWFSRSVASAIFVFCKDKYGRWCVLASERGKEAADFQGAWNCPCGYLDFDETTAQCARRECFEETGVDIPLQDIECVSFEDDPVTANRQNITFRFAAIIKNHKTHEFLFSKKGNEGEEVGEIKWIPVEEIGKYKWAFNHEERILEIFTQKVDEFGFYFTWRKIKEFFKGVMDFLFDY